MTGKYVFDLSSAPERAPKRVHIAGVIADDIARGRLKPGARLPGSRSLALMLSVHRNTVNAALAELAAQGWVHTRPARGVFVQERHDATPRPFARGVPARSAVPRRTGFDLTPARLAPRPQAAPRGALMLAGGVPDPRLFPGELLARAYRRALTRQGTHLLDYSDGWGELCLRRALAEMLSGSRGLAATEDDLIITRGSQHALWLAAHCLLGPGDRIGVESLGYPPAWDAFKSTGASLVPLSLDGDGVQPTSIEAALEHGPLRAVYLTPHHQCPTLVPLTAPRRLRILALAREHRFAVIEDDYSHEFQYEGRPRLPMASADQSGQVVYVGTLSKVFAPGLRIGYVVAPRPLLARMAQLRSYVDRQGDAVGEAAVAELIDDGELARHARRTRNVYLARRDTLAAALRRELGERVSFDVPRGGMTLWVRIHGTSPEGWAARAAARGVIFRAGRELSVEGRANPHVRMGFTRLDEEELTRAVRIAAEVF